MQPSGTTGQEMSNIVNLVQLLADKMFPGSNEQ